jgi:hypothetical protein
MTSLPAQRNFGPDQMRAKSNHEMRSWLSVLEIAVSRNLDVFDLSDVRSLLSTCSLTRKLVAPLLVKLEIITDTLPEADYPKIAASPLVENVLYLKIIDPIGNLSVNRHGLSLCSVLHRCAPQLQRLKISCTRNQDDSVFPHLFSENVQFPALRSLEMYASNLVNLARMQTSLFSMTALERLKLSVAGYNIQALDMHCFNLDDLANAPFLANISVLELNLGRSDGGVEPTAALLQRATNLKKLKLHNAHNLGIFNALRNGNLQELTLRGSNFSNNLSFPRSLLHLNLQHCEFTEGLDMAAAFFSLPALRQLKTLTLDHCYLRDNGRCYESWDCMHLISLPNLESITFTQCYGLSEKNALRIAKAAENIPNLKKFKAQIDWEQDIFGYKLPIPYDDLFDLDLLKSFCTSSLAVKLETLDLHHMKLSDDGNRLLLASKMKSFKYLGLSIDQKYNHNFQILDDYIKMIAQAGIQGGWPALEKIKLHIYAAPVDFEDRDYWLSCCYEILDPAWPGLEIEYLSSRSSF